MSFRTEIDFDPVTQGTLNELIQDWDRTGFEDNNWAGVKLAGEDRIYKFNEMICRERVVMSDEVLEGPPKDVHELRQVWDSGVKSASIELLNRVGISYDLA